MTSHSDNQLNEDDKTKSGVIREYARAVRTFSPSSRRLLLAQSLMMMTGFGLMPVLQNLFLLRLGFDVQFIGLLAGLGQVVWAMAALPAGRLSNRIGLRNGIMLGFALFGAGLALLLLVENRPASQWQAWLMASQVIFWLGAALITVTIPPYVMAVTGEQERRYVFATFSATFAFMALAGSLIGGALPGLLASRLGFNLGQPAPYRLALWLGPVLAGAAIWILSGADPAKVTRQETQQLSTARAPLALLAFFGLVAFLGAIGEGTVRTFFNVYLDTGLGVSPAAIGSIMGLAQLLPIGAALAVPFLVVRWGTGYALAAGLMGAGMFLVPLAAFPVVWVAAAAYMGVIALVAMSSTARDMFGQEIVIPRWRTTSQGVAIIGLALGWSLAGIGGGTLIKTNGFGALYFAGAMAMLLAAGLLIGYLRRASTRPRAVLEVAPQLAEDTPAL
jgi:predicted MFS family arabinose efflux permease